MSGFYPKDSISCPCFSAKRDINFEGLSYNKIISFGMEVAVQFVNTDLLMQKEMPIISYVSS